MFSLKGRVAVITGASSGLGKQMAKAFAQQGANLVLLARRIERLEKIKKQFKFSGVKILAVQCDVTKVADIKRAAQMTKKRFGRVDILVNCAGSAKNAGVIDMTDEEWEFTIKTDMDSVFYVTREFAKMMKARRYGRIINIASMYGLVGNMAMNTIAYHTSKGGVVNFTRAAAAELAKYRITVNAICPGYFDTELTHDTLITPEFKAYMQSTVPMGRYGKKGELNAGAIFLASKEASYVTGVILPIDGGYTCV